MGERFAKRRPFARSSGASSGRIAQLVEQLTLNQRVPGSSPGAPTTLKRLALRGFFHFLSPAEGRTERAVAPFWHRRSVLSHARQSDPVRSFLRRPVGRGA